MPPKIITPINNQSSATNSVQSGSNVESNPLKMVITKNTQNTSSGSTDWIIKTGKRTSSPGNSPTSKVNNNNLNKSTYTTPNRYEALNATSEESIEINDVANVQMQTENIIQPPTPPPIFIITKVDYLNFCNQIKILVGNEEFLCKTTTKNLKLILKSPHSFRQVIKLLNDKSVEYFTYQAKEDKSYRVVLKNLHPTTPTELITQDLENLGFSVRNVTNIKKKNENSNPLPLFYIDLNPAPNNPEIFKLKTLCHSIVKIEEPHSRRDLPQCHRCQNYGHTRTYCNRTPRCVRCGQAHVSDMCEKSKDTPATCALCGKDHPANYRGCAVHKELQKSRNTLASTTHEDVSRRPLDSNHPDKNKQHLNWEKTQGKTPSNATYSRSYADTLKPPNPNSQTHEFSSSPEPSPATLFSSFLEHFQSLITPLINLLTTLINTILTKNDN